MYFVNPQKQQLIKFLCNYDFNNLMNNHIFNYTFDNISNKFLILNNIKNFYTINDGIYLNDFFIKDSEDIDFSYEEEIIKNNNIKDISLYIENHEYNSFKYILNKYTIENVNIFLNIHNFFDLINNYDIKKIYGIIYFPLCLNNIKSKNSKLTDIEFFNKNKNELLNVLIQKEINYDLSNLIKLVNLKTIKNKNYIFIFINNI